MAVPWVVYSMSISNPLLCWQKPFLTKSLEKMLCTDFGILSCSWVMWPNSGQLDTKGSLAGIQIWCCKLWQPFWDGGDKTKVGSVRWADFSPHGSSTGGPHRCSDGDSLMGFQEQGPGAVSCFPFPQDSIPEQMAGPHCPPPLPLWGDQPGLGAEGASHGRRYYGLTSLWGPGSSLCQGRERKASASRFTTHHGQPSPWSLTPDQRALATWH